ncbi:MAG: amidohydrolase [Candidatus Electrothrix sp. AR3]|nr:amidohydrolase [Candidatus Electrothrix sp. AR3]
MKADILITNICLAEEQAIVEKCCLAIKHDSIVQIGPAEDFSEMEAETVLDGHGQLAMPGLVNSHCHAAMTLFRGMADDLQLDDWLNRHIFPAEAAHVNPDMVYWCSKLAAAEMILSGTTTVADGYFHEHEAAHAFADAGMRAVAAQGVIDFPAPGVADPSKNIIAAAEFIDQWQQHPLITPAVFAHSPYTCTAQTLLAAKVLARERAGLLFIHAAESKFESTMIKDIQGDSPIRHLHALGILDATTVCIHSTWVDEEDIEILAETGAGVVVCPQSNLKLASGIAPLPALLAQDIQVGLGTDGTASNNGLDMFREMDVCAKIQKIPKLDPVSVPATDVLNMATSGGASVLGLESYIGSLDVGKKADIILLNLDCPHLQPLHSSDLLVYAGGGADVQTVLINGRLVMQDRKILSFDLEETMKQVRQIARNLI